MQDKEFAAILQDEPMQPLALVPLTEEEQVCHQHTPLIPVMWTAWACHAIATW